jgi:flagellar secretion chaperone FliS
MVAKDFARVYRANSILTASPGQLVLLLYDGVLNSLAAARQGFARPPEDLRRYEVVNRQLRKAQRIIAELKGTLNFEVGGEFAPLMRSLYDYYNRRLLEANMRKDVAPVIEIERLVGEVRTAWATMLRKQGSAAPNETTPRPAELVK